MILITANTFQLVTAVVRRLGLAGSCWVPARTTLVAAQIRATAAGISARGAHASSLFARLFCAGLALWVAPAGGRQQNWLARVQAPPRVTGLPCPTRKPCDTRAFLNLRLG